MLGRAVGSGGEAASAEPTDHSARSPSRDDDESATSLMGTVSSRANAAHVSAAASATALRRIFRDDPEPSITQTLAPRPVGRRLLDDRWGVDEVETLPHPFADTPPRNVVAMPVGNDRSGDAGRV